jgi:hypothetical protein
MQGTLGLSRPPSRTVSPLTASKGLPILITQWNRKTTKETPSRPLDSALDLPSARP